MRKTSGYAEGGQEPPVFDVAKVPPLAPRGWKLVVNIPQRGAA